MKKEMIGNAVQHGFEDQSQTVARRPGAVGESARKAVYLKRGPWTGQAQSHAIARGSGLRGSEKVAELESQNSENLRPVRAQLHDPG